MQALKTKIEKTNTRMLSFVDDEDDGPQPVRPIKILSAHALLRGNDPTLAAASRDASPEPVLANAKRARSPPDVHQQAGEDEPDAGHLVKRIRTELGAMQQAVPVADAAVAVDSSAELARLTAQLRNSKRAPAIPTGETTTDVVRQLAAQPFITPLAQMRSKYISKGQVAHREKATLEKLQTFQSALRNTAAAASESGAAESYRGQVLEEAEGPQQSQVDASWMSTKLKFTRHVDDAYRGLDHGARAAADDGLMTVDPYAGTAGAGARKK
jgi:hypothetical protein